MISQGASATEIPQPWFNDGEPIEMPPAAAAVIVASRPRRWAWRALAIISQVGAADVLVALGLICLSRGSYLLAPAAGWIVPGAVLLWWALPQRPRFLTPKPPTVVTIEPPKGVSRDGRA